MQFPAPLLLYCRGNASQGTPLELIISHFVDSVNMYFNQISKHLFGYNVKISVQIWQISQEEGLKSEM